MRCNGIVIGHILSLHGISRHSLILVHLRRRRPPSLLHHFFAAPTLRRHGPQCQLALWVPPVLHWLRLLWILRRLWYILRRICHHSVVSSCLVDNEHQDACPRQAWSRRIQLHRVALFLRHIHRQVWPWLACQLGDLYVLHIPTGE